MAWDTARTRQRLLDAAVVEFSRQGPAAARVDRIAMAAGVNKERIYQYFGSKDALFHAVLEQEMHSLARSVPVGDVTTSGLGDFAGRIFDHHRANPHYLRLLVWEGLGSGTAVMPPSESTVDGPTPALLARRERAAHYQQDIDAVVQAQQRGSLRDDVDAGYLLYLARATAVWWLAVPDVARLMLGPSGTDTDARRRAVLVQLVDRATRR